MGRWAAFPLTGNEGPNAAFVGHRGPLQRRLPDAFVLVLSDVLLAFVVWSAALKVQGLWGNGPLTHVAATGVVTSVAIWIGMRAMLGLYPGYGLDDVEELRRHSYAVLVTLAIMSIVAVAFELGGSLSRLLLLAGFSGLLVLALLGRRCVKAALMRAGLWGKPVVVLGAADAGAYLIRTMNREWKLGFRPIAVFDDRLVPPANSVEGVPYGGGLEEAEGMAKKLKVDTAIIAMPLTSREHLVGMMGRASRTFRHVMVIPNLGGITNSVVAAKDFAGIFGVEVKHNLLDPWSRRIKRTLDLLGAVAGGMLIAPLLLALAALIKVDSPGPAFYGHQRLGAKGRNFRCWKFRTMHSKAEELLEEHLRKNPHLRVEWEENQKLRDDPRVTRVGDFLRKTSLDELPQLWNVLLGEMSLVGPRPIVDAEVPKYGEAYELYSRIKPGISGFWQVNGRSDTSYDERVNMDAYYVRNWSVWLDLVILARTVRAVFFKRGAY